MSKAFGTKFILLNKVRQFLPSPPFEAQRFLHLASFQRGFKEYCAFVDQHTQAFYIEEVDPSDPNLFKRISSDAEWRDAYGFLIENKAISQTGGIEEIGSAEYMKWMKLNDRN